MIDFKRYETPEIVIYHQQLPGVKSVSIDWLIFTGAADDMHIGADGAHHWFEHVPFRGTKSFPGGYSEIQRPFTRRSGTIGAWTNVDCTCYWANIHQSQWKEALRTTASLWSEPLLNDEAIHAEREIIYEEIREWHSDIMRRAYCELPGILWKNHPYGHHALGTRESLASLTPEGLRQAHAQGYDRNRAVLFISGGMAVEEVFGALVETTHIFPNHGLSERRQPEWCGQFPDIGTGEQVVETSFNSSVVFMLFPLRSQLPFRQKILWKFLANMFVVGGLESPLYRIVREERKLSYHVHPEVRMHAGGGYWGLVAKTSTSKIKEVLRAFLDVLEDPYLHSPERFEIAKEAHLAASEMRPVDPGTYNDRAIGSFRELGTVVSEQKINLLISSLSHAEVMDKLNGLTPNRARTVIFRGKE